MQGKMKSENMKRIAGKKVHSTKTPMGNYIIKLKAETEKGVAFGFPRMVSFHFLP
jgi:hypothetical protein